MSASSSQAREYLELLPRSVHAELYKVPSSVLAIFKFMLPPLAKTIVTTMLYMPTPFPAADLDAWFREDAKKDKNQAISVLETLHILSQTQSAARVTSYDILPAFRSSLRHAFEGSGAHRSFGVPASSPDSRKVDIAFLDSYARTQWENILFYMVGSTVGLTTRGAGGQDVHAATKKLLEIGDFIRKRGGRVEITREGFTFVLQDTNTQVWTLLIVYLKSARQLNMSETDVLSFLFMLSSLQLGQDYTTSTLTPTQLQLLIDLSNLGIIYRHSDNAPTFYPTRLAVTLTSAAPALLDAPSSTTSIPSDPSALTTSGGMNTTAASKGFIIVETNYRLYAYTSSLLQIAILSLFTKLSTRFPNMVSGKLTKDSIQKAVALGISSSQIITYLTAHAHPQMQKSVPFLPPTVMDQIRLWEYEGERVEASGGFLMKEFGSELEYRDLVGYAETLGVLVWRDDAHRRFFVDRIDQLTLYLQRKQAQKGRD